MNMGKFLSNKIITVIYTCAVLSNVGYGKFLSCFDI